MGNGTIRHGRRPSAPARVCRLLAAGLLVAASACGDDDDGGAADDATGVTGTGVDGADGTAATDAAEGPDATVAATVENGAEAAGEIDACALVTQEEVEAVIGMPAGSPQPEESEPPFFGCRFEDDALTHVVSIGVIAWGDADDAAASFEFGADQYPAIDGIGDRAYNSQPIGDIDVLAGAFELSVSLYFVSDDDAAELAMATELAAIALDRLP